jgi:hypothetical protein
MKCRLIPYLMLLALCQGIHAQFYNTGQDPSSIKWLQIRTNRFTLIYPESYGPDGLKFAKSLDESMIKLTSLFPEKKMRIPVIIHNYTTFSNGYVAWAPKRMEIYPTPEQDGIPLNTKEQLATHELTHVQQLASLNKGFTRAMSFITGEQFTGAVSAFLPLWFLEGDAVFAESLLSSSGRGKTAVFQRKMKAIVLEKPRLFSYDKMIAGSFKTMVPDHYQYGYQMVAWSLAKYDSRIWNKTLEFTGKYPFTLNPVNYSLQKNAGIIKSKLFRESFDSLKTIWQKEVNRTNPVNYIAINRDKKKEYVNYYSPVIVGKDSVISIKTTFSSPPEFVLIKLSDKTEKRIYIPGRMYPYFLSGSAGNIVWIEEKPDPRWENRTYSVIMIRDIRNRITRQLSSRSRYLAASVSNDGKFVAAVENTINNQNSLVILDAINGDILNKIPLPGNSFAQRPQWSDDGEEITIISLTDKGEGIMSYSLKLSVWNTLIPPGRDDLQSGILRNDSLFFVSSASGTDNLYILTPGQKITQLTNSKYGAYDPCLVEGNVIFSDYSVSGTNICVTKIKEAHPYSKNDIKDPSFLINRFDTIKIKNTDPLLTDYKPQPYRKLGHLFGFHSWMPFYADLEKIRTDPASVRPGLTLMSQNQLSTVITTVGYEYASDKTNQFHTRVTLKSWLPVIESQLDWGGNSEIIKAISTNPDPVQTSPALRFTNTIYVPLTFSTGRFSQYIHTLLSSSYLNRYIYRPDRKVYDYGQTEVTGKIYFINYRISAIRDLYPRWGQVFEYSYSLYPSDKDLYGNISTLKTTFFFPGLINNHSLKIRIEDEVQNPKMFVLQNRASFPRGYQNIIAQKLRLYSADYTMPLIYPDLNIPWVFYLKRIRGSLFYDYADGSKIYTIGTNQPPVSFKTFKSFGGEVLSDFFILRIPYMISAGVQAAWKDVNEPPVFEFLFNFDLFGMKTGRSRF